MYFPNFLISRGFARDVMEDAKKASILEGWIWALLLMSVLTGSRLPGILVSVFLALLNAYCNMCFKNIRKAYQNEVVKKQGVELS